jgi:hypothetical protein
MSEKLKKSPGRSSVCDADHDSCLCKCALSARISCPRYKSTLSWAVPREIVCTLRIAQLLQSLSLLTAEHTNASVVR